MCATVGVRAEWPCTCSPLVRVSDELAERAQLRTMVAILVTRDELAALFNVDRRI